LKIQKLAKKQVNSRELGRHKSGLTPPTPTRRTSVGRKKTASAASLLKIPVGEILQDESAVAPVFVNPVMQQSNMWLIIVPFQADCTLLDLLHRLSDEKILDVPFSETPDGHCLGQIGMNEHQLALWNSREY